MGKTWNPDAPAVLGFQGEPTNGADSGLQAFIVRDLLLDASQAETVTALRLPINDNGVANSNRPSTWLEVIPDGSQHLTGPTTLSTFQPNADGAGSMIGPADWNSHPGAGLVNLWSFIDDPVVWPPPFPQDRIATASANDVYHMELNTGAFPLTDRVLKVRLNMVLLAEYQGSGTYSNRNFNVCLRRPSDGALRYPLQGIQLWATGYSTYFTVDLGEVNPYTNLPWTPADIRSFDTGGLQVRIEAVGTTDTWATVLNIEMQVLHMTENRAAVGLWIRPNGQLPGYIDTTSLITLPGAAANWSKPSSGRFAYRWRIPSDLFVANPSVWTTTSWRTALTRVDPSVIEGLPHNTRAQVVQVDGHGLTVKAVDSDAVPGLLLIVAGNASTDSQPYYLNPVNPYVTATSALQQGQRMTPGASVSYLGVQFIVDPPNALPTATLTVTVHRSSDGVQMGGSLVLTSEQINAQPAIEEGVEWRKVQGFLSSGAALVSGTQYEVRFTPSAGDWRFPRTFSSVEGDITFGGTTGCHITRTLPGALTTQFPDEDLGVILLEQPVAIASASAEVVSTPTRLGVSCFCGVESVDNVVLSWVPNSIASFARIEVERYLDTGDLVNDAWHPVMQKLSNPTTENAKWTDYEVPRGTPARYRLRYVNTVGAWSAWIETNWVTPQAHGAEIIFTSNEQPDITVVYQHDPAVTYDLRGFNEDVLMPIDGADYQLAFIGSENRGIGDKRRIIANFGRQPCDDLGRPIGKRRIFEPLRNAVRRFGLPYVCVLDSDGNRTFAHVLLDNAQSNEPGWRYFLDAEITPITATPRVVVVP